MTSANIPAPVHGQDADVPDLAPDTGKDVSMAGCFVFAPVVVTGKDPRGVSFKRVRDCFVFV